MISLRIDENEKRGIDTSDDGGPGARSHQIGVTTKNRGLEARFPYDGSISQSIPISYH